MQRTPSPEERLNSLYLVKRDCLRMIAAAEARGDIKQARAFKASIEEIKIQIAQRGGDPEG